MPRKARIVVPGAFHHIMARGINRQNIFHDNEDREYLLRLLSKQIARDGHRLYAWALIPNHYHLLLRASDHPLDDTMKRINSPFARYFNKKHQRCGYLFQDRFKSLVTQDQNYLESILRYVHLNPIRAGICRDLVDLDSYQWCGHGVLMGTRRWEAQATEEVLRRFGKTSALGKRGYRRFIEEGLEQGCKLDEIIKAVKQSNAQVEKRSEPGCWVVGDPAFVQSVLAADTRKRLRVARYRTDNVSPADVAVEVERILEVPMPQITRRSRGTLASDARKIFAYLCRYKYGFSVKAIAEYLGIGSSPASICISRGEELAGKRNLKIN